MIDSDDEAEVTGPARLDPGERLFEHARARGVDAEILGRLEERVGSRLTGEVQVLHGMSVHASVKELIDARRGEGSHSVLARRDDRDFYAAALESSDEFGDAFVVLDALFLHHRQDQVVLAVAHSAHSGRGRWVAV